MDFCDCKRRKDHPYQPGARVSWDGHLGRVVENYKLPGDICIDWDSGCKSSYDLCFLEEEGVKVIEESI